MDIKNFLSAISQIAEEKEVSQEKVLETIEQALSAAYKKDYGKKGQIIHAKISPGAEDIKFWQVKLVVDESMILAEDSSLSEAVSEEEEKDEKKVRFNPEKHIMIEDAKKMNPKIKPGEELEIPLETQRDYGRIAAQTAKQVILQKIREAEREAVFNEYKSKEGEIIPGIVQRIEGKNVFFDIGKVFGLLPKEEQIPGEFYRPGQRLKVYILKVEESSRGPLIFLSRAYPKIISKLFELEVPEIAAGQVSIKSIAREAGSRSKVAIVSEVEGVDPIGSAVGQKGSRVAAVISELGGEKIDIVEYSSDPQRFIANALAPAKVLEVNIREKNKAEAIVPEEQLSLAIGRDGQNVRLAAKLTGWKIDVRGPEHIEKAEEEPEEKAEVVEKEKTKKKKVVKKSEIRSRTKLTSGRPQADSPEG